MPYHVRITRKSQPYDDLTRVDLNDEDLEQRFLQPYRDGAAIVIGGRTVLPDDFERICITFSDVPSSEIIAQIRAKDARSPIIFVGSESMEWRAAAKARDVTDQLITSPPGAMRPYGGTPPSSDVPADPSVVLVVHGRNTTARDEMFEFLHSIGLRPLEWEVAIQKTKKPAPYIGEILHTAFEMAQAVVVLMTPDDEAKLRDIFQQSGDPLYETELTPQARPNVLFEAGMAMGKNEGRTVLVELGTLRPFSDIAGRLVIRLDNTTQQRQALAMRLKAAGCPIDLAGTNWHTAGNFDNADAHASQ